MNQMREVKIQLSIPSTAPMSSAVLLQKARSLVIRLPNPELIRPPSAVVEKSPLQVFIGKR